MYRSGTVLVTVLVLGVVLTLAVGVAAGGSDMYTTISDVEVSDDEPTTGDVVTVTPTIEYSDSRDGGFEVSRITLVREGAGNVDVVRNVGSIAPGESIEVPLRTTVENAGERRLNVMVHGQVVDETGEVVNGGFVQRPVYLSVSEPSSSSPPTDPRVLVDVTDPVVGTDVPVTVTVSNGDDDETFRDISLTLDGPDGTQERVRPSLGPGNVTTFDFEVRPTEAGTATFEATLETDEGTVTTTETADVEPLVSDVDVYASLVERQNATALQYRVTNGGNAPLEDVVVSAHAEDAALPDASIARVEPSASETVTVLLSSTPSDAATVEATYTTGGQSERVQRRVSVSVPEDDEPASDGNEPTVTATPTATDSPSTTDQNSFNPLVVGLLALGGAVVGFAGAIVRVRRD